MARGAYTLAALLACSLSATSAKSVGPMCSPGQWTTGSAFESTGYRNSTQPTPKACCALCSTDEQCLAWNHKMPSKNCFLYHSVMPTRSGDLKQTSTLGTKFSPAPPPPPGPPPPPAPKGAMNVLMIAIDDMRPELEPYGQKHMVTPHMQKLAERSMLFERAYVQVAVCMPSRNALLFSRRPDTAKAWAISATQWPRTCGGPMCSGNECGPHCGIKDSAGKLGVSLPMWFLQNGWYTQGGGKIFHEGANTQNQDYMHSWTPSTTNAETGIFEASGGPEPMYNGTVATPSWYAFPNTDEEMTETMLAQHTVDTIANFSANELPHPFFLAVGFHKPHVPWYAPAHYWDLYPNDTISLAPHLYKPIGAPNIAMQDVMRGWSTPHDGENQLSCTYTDLCAEIYPGAPMADGRPGITTQFPYDNTTFPEWKARELRRAYWASLSYTDSNIGRVLTALDESPFAKDTVIALWGDHGYALGDNDEWAKQTNFEHATRIPFMISVPGLAPGRTPALVEQVDLFPTLVEAATMHVGSGPTVVPHCPGDTQASRGTALCTEGFSLLPLLKDSAAPWPKAAFSQFVRGASCCDCTTPDPEGNACCPCDVAHGTNIMGYTVRVDKYRFTAWAEMNQTLAQPNWKNIVATELYTHDEDPWPVDWDWEHTNVVKDPKHQVVATQLRKVITQCGQRPDLCPPELLAGLVH